MRTVMDAENLGADERDPMRFLVLFSSKTLVFGQI